jgi:hypothetical protein
VKVVATLAIALGLGVACGQSNDDLPVTPGGPSGQGGQGDGGSGSDGVYGIPLSTPTGDDQGAFYTPTLTTEGASFLLDLDTGSTVTGIAGSGCSSCSGLSPLYAPGSGATNTGQPGYAEYADMSGWSGEIYSDTVGLKDGTPNVTLNLVDITSQSTGSDAFFASNNEYQGILGMGPDALLYGCSVSTGSGSACAATAYMDKITAAGVTDKIGIEMCPTDGTLWLGGVDTSHAASALQYTPLVTSGSNSVFYDVNMTAMGFGSTDLGATASTLLDPIVDTGTSLFYIPSATETALISGINSNSAFHTLFPGQTLTDPTNSSSNTAGCVMAAATTTDALVDQMMPPLTMTFSGTTSGSITISAAPLASYFEDIGGGQYCLLIMGGGDGGNVIMGDVFLRGFVTEIDLVSNQVGFAPTSYCAAPADAGAIQHRILERGRGPRSLANERDHAQPRQLGR